MPPFVPRKRHLSPATASAPAQEPPRKRPATDPHQRNSTKRTVFDTLDAAPENARTFEDNKAYLGSLRGDRDESEASSLSELSSDDFEDVLVADKTRTGQTVKAGTRDKDVSDESGSEGEEADADGMDWEDALPAQAAAVTAPAPLGDLEITLDGGTKSIWTTEEARVGTKKGPTKIERQIRARTHLMHVQFLMWHNAIRNAWVCDKEVQKILLCGLSGQIKREVDRWRAASGLLPEGSIGGSKGGKALGKKKTKGGKADKGTRTERDWSGEAENLASNRADPLIRLLKYLAAYWKRKFKITAPGLRKQGYKPLAVLEEEVKSFQNDAHDPEAHGERIANVEEFRALARKFQGSRDVGAQLFTALLRALGVEARLVASLQPSGFGWTAMEDAHPKKDQRGQQKDRQQGKTNVTTIPETTPKKQSVKPPKRGGRLRPIDLDESGSEEDLDQGASDSDNASIVELSRSSAVGLSPSSRFDTDLRFPTYWTEALSPITNKYIPVDALVLRTVANVPDLLSSFEPRGKEAEKAKQGISYVIAFSSDGSAKDVTVRYLKRHTWPGKTKGARIPIEKIPVYNKHGKIKRYEEFDWFKTVMSGYERRSRKKSLADELEDAEDLQPRKATAAPKASEETLQGYKNSAEFVLERHLRREEALLPHAKPVKTFIAGKGDKAKPEPVYRRKDIVACKTVESWHKEGREIKVGEQPLKYVPMRVVTLVRKREIQEAERNTGEKVMQGLYSKKQTDWIVPPPIVDGIIPRNAYGNMDVFAPSMIPKGAAHVPLNGTVRICKKLGIDFAEACTGFAFGRQRAVPVLTGVVVAAENREAVVDAWKADQQQRFLKEQGKREQEILNTWKKFLVGLKIVSRMRNEYGADQNAHQPDELNPFTNRKLTKGVAKEKASVNGPVDEERSEDGHLVLQVHDEEELGGGFIRENTGHQEGSKGVPAIVEHGSLVDEPAALAQTYPQTPISLRSAQEPMDKGDPSDSVVSEEVSSDAPIVVSTQKTKKPQSKPKSLPSSRRDEDASISTPPRKRPGRPKKSESVSANKLSDDVVQRSVPKRQAARKSETAIYSHYFDHRNEESGVEETDEVEVITARGRGRRRAQN